MRKNLNTQLLVLFLIFNCHLFTFASVTYEKNLSGDNIQIGNLLRWTTSEEVNNQLFLIERSFNGIDFEKIGKINGVGNSDELNGYEFLDVNMHEDKALYRLIQMDFDGTFAYSGILQLQSVYPNNFMVKYMPNTSITTTFDVVLEMFQTGDLSYVLTSIKGDQVMAEEIGVAVGMQNIQVDLEFQPKGIYRLTLTMGEEVEHLVIQKVDEDELHNNMASMKN
ncbi:MAG: hypothetical protein ACI9XO_003033 [Paraglaciecola sp.]|jgi:hypothetical protein